MLAGAERQLEPRSGLGSRSAVPGLRTAYPETRSFEVSEKHRNKVRKTPVPKATTSDQPCAPQPPALDRVGSAGIRLSMCQESAPTEGGCSPVNCGTSIKVRLRSSAASGSDRTTPSRNRRKPDRLRDAVSEPAVSGRWARMRCLFSVVAQTIPGNDLRSNR